MIAYYILYISIYIHILKFFIVEMARSIVKIVKQFKKM